MARTVSCALAAAALMVTTAIPGSPAAAADDWEYVSSAFGHWGVPNLAHCRAFVASALQRLLRLDGQNHEEK